MADGERQGETVLVVDDERALVLLISDVLDDSGYNVLTAAHGAALQILEADVPVDLLLPDVDCRAR